MAVAIFFTAIFDAHSALDALALIVVNETIGTLAAVLACIVIPADALRFTISHFVACGSANEGAVA